MPRRRVTRNLATSLLITAAGVAVGLLWASRRQPATLPAAAVEDAPSQLEPAPVRVIPPSGNSAFDGDGPELTAVPRAAAQRMTGADDYEALAPDELSEAFLTRATESWSTVDDSADPELQGFQLATIEDLTTPELSDDPADFELPRASR